MDDGHRKLIDPRGYGARRRIGRAALAETEGFEPSVGVIPLRRFSKPLVSATHPRLRALKRKSL